MQRHKKLEQAKHYRSFTHPETQSYDYSTFAHAVLMELGQFFQNHVNFIMYAGLKILHHLSMGFLITGHLLLLFVLVRITASSSRYILLLMLLLIWNDESYNLVGSEPFRRVYT